MSSVGIVILAAGAGTRLKMGLPKPLAPIGSKKLIDFPVKAALGLNEQVSVSVVTGHERAEVEAYLNKNYASGISFAFQEKQLGTADAVKSYFDQLVNSKKTEWTFVLCADTPLIRNVELQKVLNFAKKKNLNGVAASFITCLLYTSPSPRDATLSRMPSSA